MNSILNGQPSNKLHGGTHEDKIKYKSPYNIRENNFDVNNKIQKFFICELTNNNTTENNNFKFDLKIDEYPPDYNLNIVKKFYKKLSKYNKKMLTHYNPKLYNTIVNKFNEEWVMHRYKYKYKNIYIETILNLLFNDIKNNERFLFIDLSYDCELFTSVNNRLKYTLNNFEKIIKDRNIKILTTVIYHPLYNSVRKDYTLENNKHLYKEISIEHKQNFIFFLGGLEFWNLKSMSYYSEQVNYLYFFFQIFYILNFQKKNGSFIIKLDYIIDTSLGRDLLRLIKKYYKNIYLIKDVDYEWKGLYIVGKYFMGVNKNDMKILKLLFKKLYKDIYKFNFNFIGINILNNKLRQKNNVVKQILNFCKDTFIHKLIKFDKKDLNFDKIIDNFNNKIFKYILKKNPKSFP